MSQTKTGCELIFFINLKFYYLFLTFVFLFHFLLPETLLNNPHKSYLLLVRDHTFHLVLLIYQILISLKFIISLKPQLSTRKQSLDTCLCYKHQQLLK